MPISSVSTFVPAAPLRNGSPAKVSRALADAVDAFGKSRLADFGAGFSASTYPASQTFEEVLHEETDIDFDARYTMDDAFKTRETGKKAVKEMMSELATRAADAKTEVDGDPENYDGLTGDDAEALYEDVANAALANFSPATEFQSFEFLSHDIEEDGDTTRRLLVGQKTDGSWLVLQFADFPF